MAKFPSWVAIVDDDEPIRRALCRLMRAANIDAEAFSSGAAFIHFGETQHPCKPYCVVLDLNRLVAAGFDVQAWLAKSAPQIEVIIVTSPHSAEVYTRAMIAKPLAILLQPVNNQVLLHAIALAFRRHQIPCGPAQEN